MIRRDRLTAEIKGDFVVFLIGMRINAPLKVHRWLPVARAMPRMITELTRQPQSTNCQAAPGTGHDALAPMEDASDGKVKPRRLAKRAAHGPGWLGHLG